jgi:opacity protein-like surface antigen
MLGVGAAALLGLAAPVAAQEFYVGITPFGAVAVHNGKLPSSFLILGRSTDREYQNAEMETGGGLGSAIGFWMKNRYQVELAVTYTSSAIHSTNQPDVSVDLFTFAGNVAYYLPIFGAGREIFVGAGAGVKNYDWLSDSSKAETDFSWNVGGGLSVAVMRRLGVRVEARDYMSKFGSRQAGVDGAMQHDIIISAGVTFSVRNAPGPQ